MNWSFVLSYVLPPVLGAIIGYVTNAIAIKMLFRPYRQWRVLGIPVPLTPGIIPRRRESLAESIGRMVSDELLTEDTVIRQVSSPGFIDGLRENIAEVTSRGIRAAVPEWLESQRIGEEGAGLAKEIVTSVADSPRFRQLLEQFIFRAVSRLSETRIEELLGDDHSKALDEFAGRLHAWLTSDEQRDKLRMQASEWLDRAVLENRRLESLVTDGVIEATKSVLSALYAPLVDLLLRWLRTDQMRSMIERRGRFLLRDVLNRLTTIQKLFIAAAQYDRQIEANMPAIVEDALNAAESLLSEDDTREKLVETAERKLQELQTRGMSEVMQSDGAEIKGYVERALGKLIDAAASEGGAKFLRSAIEKIIEPVGERTIADVLSNFTSMEAVARRLSDLICDSIERAFTGAGDDFRSGFAGLLRRSGVSTLGDLVNLGDEAKHRLDLWITVRVERIIRDRVPGILRTLDVRNLVEDKINGLDVEQVEGLLMRVIHRHLKWINVFGAILGFLIGMLQIVSRLLT